MQTLKKLLVACLLTSLVSCKPIKNDGLGETKEDTQGESSGGGPGFNGETDLDDLLGTGEDNIVQKTTMTHCPVNVLTEEGASILNDFQSQEDILLMGGIKSKITDLDEKDNKQHLSDLHEFVSPDEAKSIVTELKGIINSYDTKHFAERERLQEETVTRSDWKLHACRSMPYFHRDYETHPISKGPTESYNEDLTRECYNWLFPAQSMWDSFVSQFNWKLLNGHIIIKFGVTQIENNWYQTVELRPWQQPLEMILRYHHRFHWPVFIYDKPLAPHVTLQTRQILGNPEIRQTGLYMDNEVISYPAERKRIKKALGFIREAPKSIQDLERKIWARIDGRNAAVTRHLGAQVKLAEIGFLVFGTGTALQLTKGALLKFSSIAAHRKAKHGLAKAALKAALNSSVYSKLFIASSEYAGALLSVGFLAGLDKYKDHLSEKCTLTGILGSTVKAYNTLTNIVMVVGGFAALKGLLTYNRWRGFMKSYRDARRLLLELEIAHSLTENAEILKKLNLEGKSRAKKMERIKKTLQKRPDLLALLNESIEMMANATNEHIKKIFKELDPDLPSLSPKSSGHVRQGRKQLTPKQKQRVRKAREIARRKMEEETRKITTEVAKKIRRAEVKIEWDKRIKTKVQETKKKIRETLSPKKSNR